MSFPPFVSVTGIAAPLLRANLDTDVIIRIERLTTTAPSELARFAFEALRYRDDGSEEPSFVLNREPFRAATMLIVGANFGCGSSREAAVWALRGLGIRCVMASSFGDIFYNNCFQNGVLPIVLAGSDLDALAVVAEAGERLSVDLQEQRIVSQRGRTWSFDMSAPEKQGLLLGLDDLDLALQDESIIAAWEANDRETRPWATPVAEVAK
jgi:3-isopropylmalate/(R)-2-methylmalate dehydratase small subunit